MTKKMLELFSLRDLVQSGDLLSRHVESLWPPPCENGTTPPLGMLHRILTLPKSPMYVKDIPPTPQFRSLYLFPITVNLVPISYKLGRELLMLELTVISRSSRKHTRSERTDAYFLSNVLHLSLAVLERVDNFVLQRFL
jgi:hypothetical protein